MTGRKDPWERDPLCEAGVTIEVSTGMGSRVLLAGKFQREKTIWWHRL